MDQLYNSNTQNKAHREISSVYHYYPNCPLSKRNEFLESTSASHSLKMGIRTEEAIIHASGCRDDGIHTGQSWLWLISLCWPTLGGHSQCDRDERRRRQQSHRNVWLQTHLYSFLYAYLLFLRFCVGLCNII